MRICAECFKAQDWKDFFSESRVFPQKCSFCGRKADVVEFGNLFPFIHKLLTLFKKSDSGSRVYEIINDDFGIFADNKVARKILKSTIAKAQCGYSIDDSVAYIDDVVTVKERWLQIKNEVMKEHRFFTVDPTDESWDVYFASDEKYKKIKKGSKFFRGRINEDAENLFYLSKRTMNYLGILRTYQGTMTTQDTAAFDDTRLMVFHLNSLDRTFSHTFVAVLTLSIFKF